MSTRSFLKASCAAFTLTLSACSSAGAETEVEPAFELSGRVTDHAGILGAPFESDMAQQLEKLEDETGVQLVIATTPELGGEPIKQYARNLSNTWGIGDAKRDDGLLILVAPNERQVRIAVGLGLEAVVEDQEAKDIIETAILPHFRDGDFEQGLSKGVTRLIEEVTPKEMKKAA